jgi:hypothetical protein
MTEKLSHGSRGLDRRAVLKGGLLSAGIAVAGLAAQTPGVAQSPARPLPPLRSHWPGTGPHESAGNTPFWVPYWRWCYNCQGLFYGNPGRAGSACAANPGQQHRSGTVGEYGYSLYYG